MYLNSVVIVGDRFDPAIVQPERLFGASEDPGRIDRDRVVLGPIAQFSYHSGQYAFALNPSRIDLTARTECVMPDELLEAARDIFDTLEKIRSAVVINGVGLNCDCSLATPSTKSGADICNSLVNMSLLSGLTQAETLQAKTAIQYTRDPLTYNLRIEPDEQSRGKSLFVAVNGHQAVAPTDELRSKLTQSAAFRRYVEELHEHIHSALL